MTPDEFLSEIKRTLPGLTHFSAVWHHADRRGTEIGVAVQSGREDSIPITWDGSKWRVVWASHEDLRAAWETTLGQEERDAERHADQVRAMNRAMKPREVTP